MNRYIRLFLVVLLLVGSQAIAQNNTRIDSLLGRLAVSTADTSKVSLLINIANAYQDIDVQKEMKYATEALQLARRQNYKGGMASAYSAIGTAQRNASQYKIALVYYDSSLAIFKELGDQFRIGKVEGDIAYTYDGLGEHSTSLEHYFKALKIAEAVNDKEDIENNLLNMGIVFKEQGKLGTAIDYYSRAEKMSEELKDTVGWAFALGNIGNVYVIWDTVDSKKKALEYLRRSGLLFKQIKHDNGLAMSYGNIAALYITMGEYDSSVIYINEYLKTDNGTNAANTARIVGSLAETYYMMATDSAYKARKKINVNAVLMLARENIKKSTSMFAEMGQRLELMTTYELQYKIEAELGNYKDAFTFFQRYTSLKDSLFSLSNDEKIAGMETERALLVKERQIEEDKRRSKERLFFISITLLLAAIIIIIVRNFYRQRQLTAQKARLVEDKEGLLKDKDMLIKEIHHRVKNNLQVVVSLLDLQTGNTGDEIARKTMTESAARVKSISLIHRFLYQNDDVTGIEYNNFVKELFAQVVFVFKKPGQNVVLKEEVPVIVLDIDTAVPLGLIMNELLINSFKYAFPDADGIVNISLRQTGELYELTYSDNGQGLPAGFDIRKATSTGMTIMRSLSKQLGGSITYQPDNNRFVVVFKDLLGRKKIK